jgi:hypothetical protein
MRRVDTGSDTDIPRLGCPTPQRVTSYSLSPNRQRPLAGAANAAVFNTFRRFRHQVLYVVPPFVAAYAAMNWAIERYASPRALTPRECRSALGYSI